MAPDVEMKLSFPKKSPKDSDTPPSSQHNKITNNNWPYEMGGYKREPSDISNNNYQQSYANQQNPYDDSRPNQPALPVATNLNPKRMLSKKNPGLVN